MAKIAAQDFAALRSYNDPGSQFRRDCDVARAARDAWLAERDRLRNDARWADRDDAGNVLPGRDPDRWKRVSLAYPDEALPPLWAPDAAHGLGGW